MASGTVNAEAQKSNLLTSSHSKDNEKPHEERNNMELEKCNNIDQKTASKIEADNVLLLDTKTSLNCTEVKHNSTMSVDAKEYTFTGKLPINGLNTETPTEERNNINSRPIHFDAKGWSFSADDNSVGTTDYSSTRPKTFSNNSPRKYNPRSPSKSYQNADGMPCQQPSSNIPGNNEHVVLLHVNPGETISFYMNGRTQVIQGPATVRMVSCNNTPPLPMPVQVPPGHMVQQIVDENGTLRHIILSPQPPVAVPVGSPYGAGSSPGTAAAAAANPSPFFLYPHHTYPPSMQFHPHMQQGMTNQTLHNHGGHILLHHGVSCTNQGTNSQSPYSPVNMQGGISKDERTQKQYHKLKKRLEARQRDGSVSEAEFNSVMKNGNKSGSDENAEMTSISSEFACKIFELLSTVAKPNVSDVTARSALVTWSALDITAETFENCELESQNIFYSLLISDKSEEGQKREVYSGKDLEYRLSNLKPGSTYFVWVQACLNDRSGKFSECLSFKTIACKPDAPQSPKCVSQTKTSIRLKWNAAVDNGSKIMNYILECNEGDDDDNFKEVFRGLQKEFKVGKLKTSIRYKFRVSAANEYGTSDYSEIAYMSTSGIPPSQPEVPSLLDATTESLTLQWECRTSDESFTLQMEEDGSLLGFLPVYNGKETTYTCTGLRRKSEYRFRICANNEVGSSVWSNVVTFWTLAKRPQAPNKPCLKGRIYPTYFKVAWDPPKDTGGADITKYSLEMDSGDGYQCIYTGSELECQCDNLQPGATYHVKVQCSGEGGDSPFSEPCTVQTLPVAPGKCNPPRLSEKPKALCLRLEWSYPDYDGGSEVIRYEVEIQNPDSSMRQAYYGFETFCDVVGLLPGKPYAFRVRAYNTVGCGTWSDLMETTTGAGVPDVPKNIQAAPRSPYSAYVSWEEPCNNGAAITKYQLESSLNDNFRLVYVGSQLSADVKNLTPATTYMFRVQAVNSIGPSLYSDPCECQTLPSSPGTISVSAVKVINTARAISLSWNEPNDNGSAILGYNVEVGDTVSMMVEEPEVSVDGLLPQTSYRIRIQAVNSIGLGPFTSLRVTTRGLPPNPPFLECTGCTHNSLRLKWGDGKNPDFIQYTLEMQHPHSESFFPIYQGTAHNHKVCRLEETTSYVFRIYATSSEGDGPSSDPYTFTTAKTVPPAVKAPKVTDVLETSCVVEWIPAKAISNDKITYKLQYGLKTADASVVDAGASSSFNLEGLQQSSEYTVRVAAVRHCSDGSGELTGPYSPSTTFSTNHPVSKDIVPKPVPAMFSLADREPLSDQQWAVIILCGFTIFAILVAILIQWVFSSSHS